MVEIYSTATAITVAAFVLITLAESLHYYRCKKLEGLAFGTETKTKAWTIVSPFLRIIGITMLAWGFSVLMTFSNEALVEKKELKKDKYRRVVLLLDVSPSMWAHDGGKDRGKQTRGQRSAEVMTSVMNRLYTKDIRFTIVAFYTKAMTVIRNTKDPELVLNVMRDLPLTFAFPAGKTDLFSGISHTFKIAQNWPKDSTTVLMVTDGDTIPETGMPKMPASISNFVVIGVGDSTSGTYIHDHQSRQDSSTLRQLATRLGATYQNANNRQLSTKVIEKLTRSGSINLDENLSMREWAKRAILVGGIILLLLPILLELFGSKWQTHRQKQREI